MIGKTPELPLSERAPREPLSAHAEPARAVCTNCGASVAGQFCAACGQRQVEKHEWSLRHFTGHLLHELTHLDSNKILRTLSALLFRPGLLSQAYLAGRWLQFIGPIRVYLSCSAIFFLFGWRSVLTFIGYSSNPALMHGIEANAAGRGIALEQYSEHFQHNLEKYAGLLWFAGVFAIAGILKLLYRRSSLYYVQHLVFALHLVSFEFLLRLTAVGLHRSGLFAGVTDPMWTHWAVYAVQVVYAYFALRRVHNQPVGVTLVKAATLVVLSFALMFFVLLVATLIAFRLT